jgi:hypothetical protein
MQETKHWTKRPNSHTIQVLSCSSCICKEEIHAFSLASRFMKSLKVIDYLATSSDIWLKFFCKEGGALFFASPNWMSITKAMLDFSKS